MKWALQRTQVGKKKKKHKMRDDITRGGFTPAAPVTTADLRVIVPAADRLGAPLVFVASALTSREEQKIMALQRYPDLRLDGSRQV